MFAETGNAVNPGVAMASLPPADARPQAQVSAPSCAVGFVRQEPAVQLRYRVFPPQKFCYQAGLVTQA